MKKTAIALLSVASFFCGHAHAEIDDPDNYCQDEYVLAQDEKGHAMCIHRDQLDDLNTQSDEGPQKGQTKTCSADFKNAIADANSTCTSSYQVVESWCSKAAYNKNEDLKKLETKYNAYLQKKAEDIKAGKSGYKTTCDEVAKLHAKLARELKQTVTDCKQAKADCVNRCSEVSGYLLSLFNNTTSQNDKINCETNISLAEDSANRKAQLCRAQDSIADKVLAQELKLQKMAMDSSACNLDASASTGGVTDDVALAAADAKDGNAAGTATTDPKPGDTAGAGTGAGTGTNGGTQQKVGGDGNPADQAAANPPSDDGNSNNTEDQQAKKSNKPNQSEMGALMGAASSLLSAFMQKSDPQQVEPIQLDASDCRRPENMSSTVCRCQRNWTPDCNGTTDASSESFSSMLPGVGGAQMNKENNGAQFPLGPDQPVFDIPKKPGDSGGGGGGGMYGGGGGFSPPPANFIPDNNKGRGGSGLSANILNGTYGGGMMGAGGARGMALRPVMRPRGSSDPEELPGYTLGGKDDRPDFNSFLPPGAGSGGSQLPSRGISGMVGSNLQEGMHPSSTDIFKAVSNRYRQLEFTLFADK